MGKRERQEAERSAQEEIRRNRSIQDSFVGGQRQELDRARAEAGEQRTEARTRLNQFAETGGMDPSATERLRGRFDTLWQNGGYDDLEGLRSRVRATSVTGGFDPAQLDSLRSDFSARQDSGGYDPTQLTALRRGYQSFVDTGGFSPEEEGAFRRHATSGVGATYKVMASDLARRNAITGGYSGGGETAQMARQMAQEAARAGTGAEVELASQKRAGRVAGLTGSSALESGVAGGVRDIMGLRRGLESDVAAGRRAGTSLETDLEGNVAANRRVAATAEADLESGNASRRIQAAGGLVELYRSDPGYVTSLTRNILDAWSTGGKLNAEQNSILEALSRQPGLFQNIMNGIATGAGVASLFIPGAPKPTGGKGKGQG